MIFTFKKEDDDGDDDGDEDEEDHEENHEENHEEGMRMQTITTVLFIFLLQLLLLNCEDLML